MRWLDTPGLRETHEGASAVERRAIDAARHLIASADVLMALRAPDIDWPDLAAWPREPDLHVVNKCDQVGATHAAHAKNAAHATHAAGSVRDPLAISARVDLGMDRLVGAVLERLGVLAVPDDALWDVRPGAR